MEADELLAEDGDLIAGRPSAGGVPELLGGECLTCRSGCGHLRVGGRRRVGPGVRSAHDTDHANIKPREPGW